MDTQTEDNTAGQERSSTQRKGRSLPSEQHYFRFEHNGNMLSDGEQRLVERDRHRLRERQRRESMTDEQRSLERERRRLRDEQRRKSMSDEQRSLEKERRRIRERQRRNNMNDEQRAVEMERRRIRERQHRQNMGDEQRSKDRERRRLRDKQRRENMNGEQRAQERERRRLYEEQKRGNVPNERVVARRKRRAEARNHLLMSQIDQISGSELGNQNASYSSEATNGNQILSNTQDYQQVEMTNTSERSSLDINEGEMVAYNGNSVISNQNASYPTEATDVNHIFSLAEVGLKVEVTNTRELSSTTSLDLNGNTMIVYNGHEAIGVHTGNHGNGGEDV